MKLQMKMSEKMFKNVSFHHSANILDWEASKEGFSETVMPELLGEWE